MKTILIAGAGAIGCRIAIHLTRANYSITLVDDWEPHVSAIRQNGLAVNEDNQTTTLTLPITTPNAAHEPYDIIILAMKAIDAEKMVQTLHDNNAIGKGTMVLSVMNGLGHEERLSQIIPLENIFLGVTMWTAQLTKPGTVQLSGDGNIILQRADNVLDQRAFDLVHIFNDAQLNAKVSTDIMQTVWSKVTLDCVLNPICALFNKTIHEFSLNSVAPKLVKALVEENVEIAKTKGVHLNSETIIQNIENAYSIEQQGAHYPSMHQDLQSKRYTEVDYLNGQVAAYAHEAGISSPHNNAYTLLMHQFEMGHIEYDQPIT